MKFKNQVLLISTIDGLQHDECVGEHLDRGEDKLPDTKNLSVSCSPKPENNATQSRVKILPILPITQSGKRESHYDHDQEDVKNNPRLHQIFQMGNKKKTRWG